MSIVTALLSLQIASSNVILVSDRRAEGSQCVIVISYSKTKGKVIYYFIFLKHIIRLIFWLTLFRVLITFVSCLIIFKRK